LVAQLRAAHSEGKTTYGLGKGLGVASVVGLLFGRGIIKLGHICLLLIHSAGRTEYVDFYYISYYISTIFHTFPLSFYQAFHNRVKSFVFEGDGFHL